MKCEKHPKYKGQSNPRRLCKKCWKMFEKNNPDSNWNYKRWKLRCSEHKRYQGKNPPDRDCEQCWKYYQYRADDPMTKEEYEKKQKQKEQRRKERKRKKKLEKERRKRKKKYRNKLNEYLDDGVLYKQYKTEYKGDERLSIALIDNFVNVQSLYQPFNEDKFKEVLYDVLKIDKKQSCKKFIRLFENNIEDDKFDNVRDYFLKDREKFFKATQKLYIDYLIERYINNRGKKRKTNFNKYYNKLENYYES